MSSAPYIKMIYGYSLMVANRSVRNTDGVNHTSARYFVYLFLSPAIKANHQFLLKIKKNSAIRLSGAECE